MRYWYISVTLCIVIAYGLYEYSDTSLVEDTTCHIGKKTKNYCHYVSQNCSSQYYSIAIKYYCSKYYPSYLLRITTSVVILLVLLLLLLSLSLLVSNYLFPNLNDIAMLLHINDQILSSILIPSTNACGDFINYYVALNSNSIDLVLGQLLGSLLIILTVIIGLISYLRPIKVAHAKWVLFDFMWILAVLVLLLYILSDGIITITECLIMVTFYFGYMAYLLLTYKQIEPPEIESNSVCSAETIKSINHTLNVDDALNILTRPDIIRSPSPMHQIDEEILDHETEGWYIAILQHLLACIDFIFAICIPVSSSSYYHSKLFQICHICFISYIANFQFFNLQLYDLFPLTLIGILLIEFILPILQDYPKLRQLGVNSVGILMSMILMSQISKQALQIFKNLGLILRISDYLLGLIVFSISNSINDIVTNITVSTTVNPMFGINACLGTPLLLILLGLGVNGLILNLNGQTLAFNPSTNLIVSLLGLIVTIIFYLIYIPSNDWKFDKKMGIIVIAWWLIITISNFAIK